MSTSYGSPLDQLLVLPLPEFGRYKAWPAYLEMGFTPEHVAELIRMVNDAELWEGDGEDPGTYAPVHAWRTLGLLRAEAAIGPLVAVLESSDDWAQEEIPAVLGMIGPTALEPVRAALARTSRDWDDPWVAGAYSGGLVEIAQRFPETRDAAVAVLKRQLVWWGRQPSELNAMLVHDLVALKAVEAVPVIQQAFEAEAVDPFWENDWEDVQVALGLIPERVTPRPPNVPLRRLRSTAVTRDPAPGHAHDAKRRHKAQKAARQRNRRRR